MALRRLLVIIISWIYLAHIPTTCSLTATLSTYNVASFAIPNDLFNDTCDECRSSWNHFAIHNVTGGVYVGGSNILVHLDPDLMEMKRVNTLGDGYSADGRRRLSVNKLLTIYYGHAVGDKLITCESTNDGNCTIRNVEDISDATKVERPAYVVPSGNGTTAYILRDDQLYIAATRDPERERVLPVRRIPISDTESDFFSLRSDGDSKVSFDSTANIPVPFEIRYVGEFIHNSFTYFVTSQQHDSDTEDKRFYSKLNRVCHESDNFNSYAEITIKCLGNSGDSYNLVQAAYVGQAGSDLAISIGVNPGDDILYAVFAKSVDEEDNEPSNHSALCVFKLDEIEKAFINAIVDCFMDNDYANEIYYLQGGGCTATGLDLEFAQIHAELQKCNALNYAHPKGSIAKALNSSAITEWPDILPTSIITTTERHHTIAFIGSAQGNLIKLHIENTTNGRIYETLSLGSGPVLKDMALDAERQHVIVLTKRKIYKLTVENCSYFSTCKKCIGLSAAEDWDPYCGWCAYEGRCTRWHECSSLENSTQWISYNETQWKSYNDSVCPPVQSTTPSAYSPTTIPEEDPTIASFSPMFGPKSGGTRVTIIGSGLLRSYIQFRIGNASCELNRYLSTSDKAVCFTAESYESNESPITIRFVDSSGNKKSVNSTKSFWYRGDPTDQDVSRGVNEDLDSIAKIPVTENNVVDVLANVTQVINEVTVIDSKGLESIAVILDGVADLELPAENLTRSVVAIVDDVLTKYNEDHNEDSSTPQDDNVYPIEVSPIPNQIQRALENQISSLQSDPDGSNNIVIKGDNVVIHAVKIPRESLINNNLVFESIPSGDVNSANGRSTRVHTGNAPDKRADAAIYLPSDVFLSATGNSSAAVPVSFFVYQNTKLFPSQRLINDSDNPNHIRVAVASRIITANVEGAEDIIDLPENSQVETIFALVLGKDQNARIGHPQCVFWDVNANDGVGDWSNEGCRFNRTLKDGNVVCQCNHLTSFAVLVDIYDQKALVLDFISKIGCGISIACLLITLVTYLSNRKLHEKQPQQIMLHFCFSLLCLYLVFVLGIDRTTPRWGCTAVSVLIHYFALTSISWMGVEATNMYILFVKVVGVHITKFMLKSALVAWGLPAVIVTIALCVDHTQYVNQQHCFLEIGNTFYFAQLLIMGLVISYNMVIFMLVMYRLLFRRAATSRSRDDKKAEIIRRVQNAVSITALLGLTWVFGLLSLIHEQSSLAFQVLFCLFNSMQGCLVFVMFCVRQKNVLQVWKGWFSFGKDSRRGDVTRTTSAASSTPDRPVKKQPRGNLTDKGRNDINMDQFQCTYIPPTITKPDDDVLVDSNERKIR